MENTFLIDLSIKYGLNGGQLSKIADIVNQCGVAKVDSHEGQQIARYVCETGMVDKPAEEVMEALRLKGFVA